MSLFSLNSYARTGKDPSDPSLQDRRYRASIAETLEAIEEVTMNLDGFTYCDYEVEKGEIHIERAVPILPLSDDIYLYLRPVSEGTLLWGHSASRVGKWDFGFNAESLRKLLSRLDSNLERV